FLQAVVSAEAAANRRRRLAVVGGFIGLSALVVAAMVALVIIQKSRNEATKQRTVAVEAQKEAEHQLAPAPKKEQERQIREAAKERAVGEKQVVDVALGKSKEELEKTNKELTVALAQSTENEKLARASAEKARQATAEAVAAQDVAVKAKSEAER